VLGQLAVERQRSGGRAGTGGAGDHVGDRVGDAQRTARRQRGDHLGRRRQLRFAQHLLGHLAHLPAQLVVPLDDLGRLGQPGLDEQRRRTDQRIGVQVAGDLLGRPVRDLGVRAGVPHQPDHRQVQHRGPALFADVRDGLRRGVVGGGQVATVRGGVPDAGPRSQRFGDPSGRRRHADAPSVVLADQEQRQAYVGVVVPAGGVEGSGGGGVVDRRVAERGDHDRVVRPWCLDAAQRGGAADAEADADGSGQVRGHRRRGGDDLEIGAAEDLVPAAGDRFLGGRDHPAQYVPCGLHQALLRVGERRPGTVEPRRTVMQQRRVVRPQRCGHRGVALVTG
jgi:hypothetical protein